MKELWLNFKDEKGKDQRVLVEGEKFAIGRTPDNDLQIPLVSLSRQHAKIERFADVFVISDCGSSNGSSLNGEKLEKPVGLKNGDKLSLGDAIEIEIEITSDEDEDANGGVSPAPNLDDDENDVSASASSSAGSGGDAKAASASSSGGGSSSLWLLMLAPILMVLVLLGLGGAILIARSQREPEIVKNDNTFNTSKDDDGFSGDDGEKTPKEETPTPTTTATPISNSGGTSTPDNNSPNSSTTNNSSIQTTTPEPGVETTSTPKLPAEGEKIKFASANFLRRIANTDPHAFLLDKQIAVLNPKINQFKGSGALAENIKNAKKNSSKITEIATSKGLKPQLLAVAALTKLGNQKGDVVAVAGEMVEKISNIMQPFGNDFADDSLLIIAAYNGGKSGEQLQNTVGTLSNKVKNATPRTIRSIWFFKENNELNNIDFDFALQFLAIGTITQNPKDFNVSAEALVF